MKSVMLGQQGMPVSARAAGRELLGSTFLAGAFALAFWFALKFWPSLWMFGLWMLLFGMYFGAKLYRRHRHPVPGFVLGERGRDDADPARPGGGGQWRQRRPRRVHAALRPVRRGHGVRVGRDRGAGVAARAHVLPQRQCDIRDGGLAMLMNILIGLATMAACLMLQSWLIVVALRYYVRHNVLGDDPSALRIFGTLNAVMVVLVLGNCAQLTVWAIVLRILGEFEALGVAVYHSAVNFASLGYGDIVMSERWRLLGPLEAVNGVLMIGVSTAVFMTVLQDTYQKTKAARGGQI